MFYLTHSLPICVYLNNSKLLTENHPYPFYISPLASSPATPRLWRRFNLSKKPHPLQFCYPISEIGVGIGENRFKFYHYNVFQEFAHWILILRMYN